MKLVRRGKESQFPRPQRLPSHANAHIPFPAASLRSAAGYFPMRCNQPRAQAPPSRGTMEPPAPSREVDLAKDKGCVHALDDNPDRRAADNPPWIYQGNGIQASRPGKVQPPGGSHGRGKTPRVDVQGVSLILPRLLRDIDIRRRRMEHLARRIVLGLVIAAQYAFGGLPVSAQLSVSPPKSGVAAHEPLAVIVRLVSIPSK